jgi:glycoprotein endo-alpha-1,2-mannosidase
MQKTYRTYCLLFLLAALMLTRCASHEVKKEDKIEGKAVVKTNAIKIYMHYMPWFQSKEVSGFWGQHWRMNTANPEIVDADGKRQIASNYYPLIGPYDSKDPDVLEYHLLLMKYAGVDAVLLDWYGSFPVTDYQRMLTASNSLIDILPEVGLQFAIVYEEYTAETAAKQSQKTPVQVGQADLSYMQDNYFKKDTYLQINKRPLLLTFGPRFFKTSSQWDQILQNTGPKPVFIPLWFHTGLVGGNANGEYSWIDFKSDYGDLKNFYASTAFSLKIGSAFPRYDDYYVQGGWGDSYGHIEANSGETFASTLNLAKESGAKYLQLVTWNDFGEGTVIEPTVEDQFTFLEKLQQFTGVTYTRTELELIHDYYTKKKKYSGDQASLDDLKKAFNHLVMLETTQAKDILDTLK